MVLLPPFCCFCLGSSEDFGLVLGGAERYGVVLMGRRVSDVWWRRRGRVKWLMDRMICDGV